MKEDINMLMMDKIHTLTLCADILESPDNKLDILEEFQKLTKEELCCDFDEIQSEFIKIFLINSTKLKCVPFSSWWIDGKMCGNSLDKINNFYEKCGYVFDVDSMKKPADHISFMIRFVSILAQEDRFEEIKEFSVFLTWLEDLANSLQIATKVQNFQLAVRISLQIINSLKERKCEILQDS